MRRQIIEAQNLPHEEKVYMKKDFFGWRVVHPIKNEDGSLNWFNMLTGGSWGNLALLICVVGIVCFGIWSHYHDIEAIKASCVMFKGQVVQGAAQSFPGLN